MQRPALIESVAPAGRAVSETLGEAEQGRWRATIRPDTFGLERDVREQRAGKTVRPAVGVRFTVDLPDRQGLELTIAALTEVVNGVTTMIGKVNNEPDHDFVLSLEGDKLLGTIEEGDHIWLIEPDESFGDHLLRKVHRGLIPRAPDDEADLGLTPIEPTPMAMPDNEPAPMSGTNGGVDVLFLYASDVTNPNLRASDIVGRFTLVRNNSAISTNNSITSVGVFPVASNFSGLSRQSVLNKMKFGLTPFSELENWTTHTNADVTFLLVSEDSSVVGDNGIHGRAGGVAVRFQKSTPYALSTITYALGDNTAVHELGHVFCGHHEGTHSVMPPDAESTNHPTIAADCSWMTIMGGYDTTAGGCPFTGLPATTVRINYFSNPALTPTAAGGNTIGVAGYADMESWLESSMPTVSAWRDNGSASAPAAPASLSHTSLMCWGDNIVHWSSASGATEYRLFQSATTTFSPPTQVYQGAGTSVSASVPAGGAYYRVHACNSAGCSNWTGTYYVPYFSGCP